MLVHNGGLVKESNKAEKTYVRNSDFLRLNSSGTQIIVEEGLLTHFVGLMRKVYVIIGDSLPDDLKKEGFKPIENAK